MKLYSDMTKKLYESEEELKTAEKEVTDRNDHQDPGVFGTEYDAKPSPLPGLRLLFHGQKRLAF